MHSEIVGPSASFSLCACIKASYGPAQPREDAEMVSGVVPKYRREA